MDSVMEKVNEMYEMFMDLPMFKKAVVLVVVGLIVYYVYKHFFLREDMEGGEGGVLRFFYADWCPHCQKSKPEWEEFKQQFSDKNKLINGYRVNCIDIDCSGDIDQDSEIMNLMNKFKIESYPSINLTLDGDETIDFDSKISKETLDTFVNTVLNE